MNIICSLEMSPFEWITVYHLKNVLFSYIRKISYKKNLQVYLLKIFVVIFTPDINWLKEISTDLRPIFEMEIERPKIIRTYEVLGKPQKMFLQ